jgi:hypothetical protein
MDNAPIIIEKHDRDRSRSSKNKVKIRAAASTSTTPVKHHHGHPLGSKNKKSSAAAIIASGALDAGLTQSVLPERSSGSTFCFFAFADAAIVKTFL